MENQKIRYAVIGISMGGRHLISILHNRETELVAICDVNEEALWKRQKKYRIPKATTNWRDLVDDPDIDAVVVATPDQTHLEMSSAFLRAGKHVLCEKPMALTMEECMEMMQVEAETGKILMVGQIGRCAPGFCLAKKLVAEGRIGELYFVESEYAHDYSKIPGAANWRLDPNRHAIIGGGCHAIDLLRWIAGDPTEAFAYANRKCLPDWPVDDCAIALFQFPNNVMGKVMTSIGCKRDYTMRTVLYGTKGTIIVDNKNPQLILFEDDQRNAEDGMSQHTIPRYLPVAIADHNTDMEIEQMTDAILGRNELVVTSLEGAKTIAACLAVVESVKTHAPIAITYPEHP